MTDIKFGDISYFTLLNLNDKLKFRDYERLGLENLDKLKYEVENKIEAIHKKDMETRLKNLKNYAHYLIESYKEIHNQLGDSKIQESSIYWDLIQFCEEDRIKDLFESNEKFTSKVKFINNFSEDILKFAKNWDINIEIKSFQEFMK